MKRSLMLCAAGALLAAGSARAQTVAVTATILPEVRLAADPVVLSDRGALTVGVQAGEHAVQGVLATMKVPVELLRRLNPARGSSSPSRNSVWTRAERTAAPREEQSASYVVTWTVVPKGT